MIIEKGSTYIKNLIKKGENQTLDFKFAINDSRKIAKSLVAFANTDGGTLLIGVKDNGSITGVQSEEEYYMVEAAALMYSKPEVFFETKHWEIGEKVVLEVSIPKSDKMPHFAQEKNGNWLAYIRHDDNNLLVNRVQLKVWQTANRKSGIKIKYSNKERFLLSYLEDNETITISKFCKIGQISRFIAEKILVDFILLDLIEIVYSEQQIAYKLTKKQLE